MHAKYDCIAGKDTREFWYGRATIHTRREFRALVCEQGDTRAMMHARGDKPATCDTRKLPSARPTIRNRLLGVINLPAVIHASCDTREL